MGGAEVFEELEDLGLDGDVEGGGGLVGDEDAGLVGWPLIYDGDGDEDALALASGELVGIVFGSALGVWEGDLVHGG